MPETSEIQQAIIPLVRSMDKLEQQYERLIVRIDNLPNIYMTRTEYEARHKELERRLDSQDKDNEAIKETMESRQQLTRMLIVMIILGIIAAIVDIVLHFAK